MIRNADGSATFARDAGFKVAGTFAPNVRQAVVRFKAGEKSSDVAKEVSVSLFATVRSGLEPLAQTGGLELNRPAMVVAVQGVELTAVYKKADNGLLVATVTLCYDPLTGNPAGMGDELLGVKGGAGPGNQTVYGLRVTDAAGKPYHAEVGGRSARLNRATPAAVQATLELHPDKDGQGPPTTVTFWGPAS